MRFRWKKKWKALTSPGMTDVCMHADTTDMRHG